MGFWQRGRQRYNSVAVGGSFNACIRDTTRAAKERTNASLICCMSAGSDAFIMRPPASKHTPVPPLPSRGEKRPPVSPGLPSRVCLRARNAPRGKHERRCFHVCTRTDNGGRHGETHAELPSYASNTSRPRLLAHEASICLHCTFATCYRPMREWRRGGESSAPTTVTLQGIRVRIGVRRVQDASAIIGFRLEQVSSGMIALRLNF